MKKNKMLLWVGLAVAAWYLWKMNKKGMKAPGTGSGNTPSGSMAQSAGKQATEIVENVIDKTTFLPDLTTDRELYAQDQNSCK